MRFLPEDEKRNVRSVRVRNGIEDEIRRGEVSASGRGEKVVIC